METALRMNSLLFKFRGFTLGPLDLEIGSGTVCGLIGSNGAGKTTTMNLVAGLLKPHGGSVEIFGNKVDPDRTEWKKYLGFVMDSHGFFEFWTGRKNLHYLRQFYPEWDIQLEESLSRRFALDLDKPVRTLSRGNRAKLALIEVMARSPKLVLFDEPLSGVDPLIRSEFQDIMFELVEKGESTIVYSTHNLAEIARIVDELILLEGGQIVGRQTRDKLEENWARISFSKEGPVPEIPGVVSLDTERNDHLVVTCDREKSVQSLKSIGIKDLRLTSMTLEDIVVYQMRSKKNDSGTGNGRAGKGEEPDD